LGYSSSNPLIIPAAAAPPIDSSITGIIDADGTVTLNYAEDLFPSHGIQVLINGTTALTDTVGDASCLGQAAVLGPAGAALLGWGLTHPTNEGSVTITPTQTNVMASTPDPLCDATYWNTAIYTPGFVLGLIHHAPDADGRAAAAATSPTVTIAPLTNGSPGKSMSLAAAQNSGLVGVTPTTTGDLITSATTHPVKITVSGTGTVIGTTEIIDGRAGPSHYYSPTSGTVTITASTTATVTHDGGVLAAQTAGTKPPVTHATVTFHGDHATVRFHATDRVAVVSTVALIGKRQLTIRHGTITIPRAKLAKLRFYSVDAAGDVEHLHGLTKRQLR
jgi:hypothetical protein